MEQFVPWTELAALIAPYYPEGKTGRPRFYLATLLRAHYQQLWFSWSNPAMEEAFFDTSLSREFARLEEFDRLPDESTILRFRHRLEKHRLAQQILTVVNELLTQRGPLLKAATVVDPTLIAATSSTRSNDKARDPEMHSGKKRSDVLWHEGPCRYRCRLAPGAQGARYFGQCARTQSRRPRQSRAPVSGGQEPVWLCQSSLPGAEEKCLAVLHAVCPIKSVDGARQNGAGA